MWRARLRARCVGLPAAAVAAARTDLGLRGLWGGLLLGHAVVLALAAAAVARSDWARLAAAAEWGATEAAAAAAGAAGGRGDAGGDSDL